MAKDFEKANTEDSNSTFNDPTNQVSNLPAPAHTLTGDEVLKLFQTDAKLGLHTDIVGGLQEKYGPNRLKPPPKPSLLKIFGRQVFNAMTLVLIAAMAVSFGTQDWISGGVIFALILMNIITGAYAI